MDKKQNTEIEKEQNTEIEKEQNTEKEKKQDTEKVAVFVPKQNKNDKSLFVAVNGRRILIQKGQTVMVDKMFAEVIKNSMKQTELNDEYIAKNAN